MGQVNDGGGEEVTPRLRKTLMRIAGYPPDYTPGTKAPAEPPSNSAPAGTPVPPASSGQKALTDRVKKTNLFRATREKFS
eukprot:scaffold389585_cov29-Prasinocladus_malaysianus.AAC.1